LQFGIEDWWVSDIASFYEQSPSKLFIETLEDCELLTFNPESKEELLIRVPKFERVFRLMVQRNLAATVNRLINTISKTAQEKYLDFIERYPTLFNRISLSQLCSYLGIERQTLTRIRQKLAH